MGQRGHQHRQQQHGGEGQQQHGDLPEARVNGADQTSRRSTDPGDHNGIRVPARISLKGAPRSAGRRFGRIGRIALGDLHPDQVAVLRFDTPQYGAGWCAGKPGRQS